jgi:hypothetical protein
MGTAGLDHYPDKTFHYVCHIEDILFSGFSFKEF